MAKTVQGDSYAASYLTSLLLMGHHQSLIRTKNIVLIYAYISATAGNLVRKFQFQSNTKAENTCLDTVCPLTILATLLTTYDEKIIPYSPWAKRKSHRMTHLVVSLQSYHTCRPSIDFFLYNFSLFSHLPLLIISFCTDRAVNNSHAMGQ